jgi:hypothetical protein
MKDEWRKGLQWGSVAWLAHIFVRHAYSLAIDAGYSLREAHHTVPPSEIIPTAAWGLAFALIWTRWSRIAAGAAIGLWALQSALACTVFPSAHEAVRAWAFGLPMVLPLLPVLAIPPERPRLTLALILVGRWRDAIRELAGWRWIAVAAGIYLLDRSANAALGCNSLDEAGVLRFALLPALQCFLPQAILFGLASLPRIHARATA